MTRLPSSDGRSLPPETKNTQQSFAMERPADGLECEAELTRWMLYRRVRNLQAVVCELLITNQQLRMEIQRAQSKPQ